MATFKEVIAQYIDGATEDQSSGQGNLAIHGDLLTHYMTTIAERTESGFLLNMTLYSNVTQRLQKQLEETLPKDKTTILHSVPEGYSERLSDLNDAGSTYKGKLGHKGAKKVKETAKFNAVKHITPETIQQENKTKSKAVIKRRFL